jgi:hypothetical protein
VKRLVEDSSLWEQVRGLICEPVIGIKREEATLGGLFLFWGRDVVYALAAASISDHSASLSSM